MPSICGQRAKVNLLCLKHLKYTKMFGGFKASLNLFSGKKNKKQQSELSSDLCVIGAYRTSRENSFGYNHALDTPKRPNTEVFAQIRPKKGTNNLARTKINIPNLPDNFITEISSDPRGAEEIDPRPIPLAQNEGKLQEKEQKKLENQRLAEQRQRDKTTETRAKQERASKEAQVKAKSQVISDVQSNPTGTLIQRDLKQSEKEQKKLGKERLSEQKERDKISADSRAKQERDRIERERKMAQKVKKNAEKMRLNPQPSFESSISKSSGPPPYSEVPAPAIDEINPDKYDGYKSKVTGNVTFSKPVDSGTWDMISQHRDQINKPVTVTRTGLESSKKSKQIVMDLNYNFSAPTTSQQNSEA